MKMKRWAKGLLSGALGLTLAGAAQAQAEKPQYGGTLEVGTVYVTLSALSFEAQSSAAATSDWYCGIAAADAMSEGLVVASRGLNF